MANTSTNKVMQFKEAYFKVYVNLVIIKNIVSKKYKGFNNIQTNYLDTPEGAAVVAGGTAVDTADTAVVAVVIEVDTGVIAVVAGGTAVVGGGTAVDDGGNAVVANRLNKFYSVSSIVLFDINFIF